MSDGHQDLRCRLGRHHYVGVMDDNPPSAELARPPSRTARAAPGPSGDGGAGWSALPGLRGQGHLECTRCGHIKDIAGHEPLSLRGVTRLGGSGI
jgi:hypothetical protein